MAEFGNGTFSLCWNRRGSHLDLNMHKEGTSRRLHLPEEKKLDNMLHQKI